jgi:hypothetical protein
MLSHDAAYPDGETIVSAADGIVKCSHRRVAIIGAGLGRKDAPWSDPTWCFQALNEIWQIRYERHWECHPLSVQSDAELAWLERCRVPCYVLDLADAAARDVPDERPTAPEPGRLRPFAGVANAVQYPLERVLAATGGRRYFTSTFSYQIALAIADGFEAIGLWGVELYEGSARERTVELACLEYWIGVADGRGVKLTLGSPGLARRPYLYGYHYAEERDEVNARLDDLRWVLGETRKREGKELASP